MKLIIEGWAINLCSLFSARASFNDEILILMAYSSQPLRSSTHKKKPLADVGRSTIFDSMVGEFANNAYVNRSTSMSLGLKVSFHFLFQQFDRGLNNQNTNFKNVRKRKSLGS